VTHPVDAGLRALGIDPASLSPDVLDALRDAQGTTDTPTVADQFAAAFEHALNNDPAAQLAADLAAHHQQETDRG
jgi:hypothetical protein